MKVGVGTSRRVHVSVKCALASWMGVGEWYGVRAGMSGSVLA